MKIKMVLIVYTYEIIPISMIGHFGRCEIG